MKRLLLATLALALVLLHPSAHAQMVAAYARDNVEASADWIAGRSKGLVRFRYVHAGRYANPVGATDTIVEVGDVFCKGRDARSAYEFTCEIKGRLLFVKPTTFQFDSLVRSARLKFRDRGVLNVIEWKARDGREPRPAWGLQGGERSMVANVSLRAEASVKGRVGGQRFSNDLRKAHASMRRSTEAGAIYEVARGGSFTVEASSERIALRAVRDRI